MWPSRRSKRGGFQTLDRRGSNVGCWSPRSSAWSRVTAPVGPWPTLLGTSVSIAELSLSSLTASVSHAARPGRSCPSHRSWPLPSGMPAASPLQRSARTLALTPPLCCVPSDEQACRFGLVVDRQRGASLRHLHASPARRHSRHSRKWKVKRLDACGVKAEVVRGPAGPVLVALGLDFADQVGEIWVRGGRGRHALTREEGDCFAAQAGRSAWAVAGPPDFGRFSTRRCQVMSAVIRIETSSPGTSTPSFAT